MSEKRTLESPFRAPPLKKRFSASLLAQTGSVVRNIKEDFPIESSENDMDTGKLTKSELLQLMRSAKEQYLIQKAQVDEHTDVTLSNDALSSLIRLQLDRLRNEIMSLAKIIANPNIQLSKENETLSKYVEEIQDTVILVINHLRTWLSKSEESLMKGPAHFIEFIKQDINQLDDSRREIVQSVAELRNIHENQLYEIDSLSQQAKSTLERVELSKNKLEETRQSISSVQKRFERSKSHVVSDIFQITTAQEVKPAQQSENQPQSKEQPLFSQQLAECQYLIDVRTHELQDKQRIQQQLRERVDQLVNQFNLLSNDYIRQRSDDVKRLESSIDYEIQLGYYYEDKRRQLMMQDEHMRKERRKWINQNDTDKAARDTLSMAEMKRLQDHLARIKNQRDDMQRTLDNTLANEKQVLHQHQLTKQLATQQKDRILDLGNEILHKQRQDNEELLITYRKLKSQIEQTHGILHALKQRESVRYEEASRLMKTALVSAKQKGGASLPILEQLSHQAQQLTLLVNFFEKTEFQLYAQMDCDGRIYEQRQSNMNRLMVQNQQHQIKLQAEIAKYITANNKLINKVKEEKAKYALKREQVQSHNKAISHLKEKAISIEEQVMEKEHLISQLTSDLERERLQVEDNTQECSELQTSLVMNETQLTELQTMANIKTRALEEQVELTRQYQQEHEKLQKKCSMIEQGYNPASQELIDEVEELRAQFKCSTCRTRTRECILLSCFHTFCKECIKTRLDTRQRRCPSCALTFGASDVKSFYLYNT